MVAKSRISKKNQEALEAQLKPLVDQIAALTEQTALIMAALDIEMPSDEDEAVADEEDAVVLDYEAMTVPLLEAEIERREIDISEIEGTGKDGNVVKPDLIHVLMLDDAEAAE